VQDVDFLDSPIFLASVVFQQQVGFHLYTGAQKNKPSTNLSENYFLQVQKIKTKFSYHS